MIVQLVTAILLAIILILLAWAVFRTIRKPMPRALIPLIAGATAIGYGVYSEYTWEDRMLAKLPASMEVVHSGAGQSVFSPWSFLLPRTDRLSVVDTHSVRRNPEFEQFAMLELLFLQRFNPVLQVRQLIDCDTGRRADLTADAQFDEQGLPLNLDWQSLDSDERLLEIACQG